MRALSARKQVSIWSLMAISMTAAQAHAQDEYASRRPASSRKVRRNVASLPAKIQTQTQISEEPVWEEQSGTAFVGFLGVGGGILSTSASDPNSEINKSGSAMLGKASLVFYNESLALEASLGMIKSGIKGKYEGASASGSEIQRMEAQIITQAGVAEFSPRFRLSPKFDVGPMVALIFGTQANFGETAGGDSAPMFVGAKAAATWDKKDYQIRAVIQAATSVSIPERQAFLAVAGLEIGLPFVKGRTILRERKIATVRDNFERETIEVDTTLVETVVEKVVEPQEVVREVVKEVMVYSLDDQVVHFEFDRANLLPESKKFLFRMGRFLAENPTLWESLRIDGHTDDRGGDEYNRQLSMARAASVKNVLLQAGVNPQMLSSNGFGKARPIDRTPSEVGRARNRRVELGFAGVSDAGQLRDGINRIKLATITPSTCRDGICK